jgi:membrane protein DedA with SNARE-associated domain
VEGNFQALADWLGQYGYPILFALVFAESAGVPVPGETAVLAAAVLASRPDSPFKIEWVIGVVIAAAVLGDNLGFWVGHRWARPRLREGKRFFFLTPQALKTVEGYFEHYGSLTVAVSRFIAGLRVVAALAAGVAGMPWPRFLLANLGGAVAWAVTMSLLGYFFGHSLEKLHHLLGRGALVLLGCVALVIGLIYLLRRVRHLPGISWNRLLGARIWEGFVTAALVILCVSVLVIQARHPDTANREDEEVRQWVEERRGSPLDSVAAIASYLGSLPVAATVTALLLGWAWYAGLPTRERVVIVWALAGSEAVGLVLLALIRHKGIEPARALAWPFGFAGLAPLRAAAVFGMAVHVTRQLAPRWSLTAALVALGAILLTGFSVVWGREQRLTEVVVEYAAGGLVLFLGMRWLAQPGLGPVPASAAPVEAVTADKPAGAS